MAVWQVMKQGVPTGQYVDDQLELEPGDEGFTHDPAVALAVAAGGDGVNYVGRSE